MPTRRHSHGRTGPEQRIKISKDGPYLASGSIPLIELVIVSDEHGDPLAWRTVREYAPRERYRLCRCGQSQHKPLCDGSHQTAAFDGTETADRRPYGQSAECTEGPTLDLLDAPALCIGSSFCDRAGGTWDLVRRSNDPEARRIALEEAANCPSGRLVAVDKEGQVLEPGYPPSIAVISDPDGSVCGALWVRGGIPIEAADGQVYEVRNRVTLCGCGQSSNKPFCDGSHRDT
jgi:CDGSH-type Zn-finger protein